MKRKAWPSDATIAQRRRVLQSAKKVAVITGAAQGIGRRTAELFAEQGYSLVLVDLKPMDTTARARSEERRVGKSVNSGGCRMNKKINTPKHSINFVRLTY